MRDKIEPAVLVAVKLMDIELIVGNRVRVYDGHYRGQADVAVIRRADWLLDMVHNVGFSTGVPAAKIMNRPHKCRLRPASDARAMFCFYMNQVQQNLSIANLAVLLGLERSSVAYAFNRHVDLMAGDAKYKERYLGMVQALEEPF